MGNSSRFFLSFLLILSSGILVSQIKSVKVNGAELHYTDQGKGETVLFVHGTQEDYRVFSFYTDSLAKDFRVITYSRRYNYPNTNAYTKGDEFSARSEAKDLADFVKALGLGRVHLVGHSFGGIIAMQFASDHPEMLRSLVLSEPALVSWVPGIPGCEGEADAVQQELIEDTKAAFEAGNDEQALDELIEFFWGADFEGEIPPEIILALEQNLPEVKALAYSEDPFTVQSPDNSGFPLLILTAGNTMPMLRCTNKKLLEKYAEAKNHHLLHATHDLWATEAEVLLPLLAGFWKG
ncbi:alpha/beta hydrolase [Zeaxanthinibacter sp. PT1]|uniref:alpha/beta fold hydrolase n=1 Tax=Zeaxanthinibacter TaxID=561554 RepID=UPI00234A2D87|nr:alpha/beta hydrolase [Zeaxanthinibacter sp. PT1]MDC6351050.1 alpha/beta hydrolase [Zeaxanthinibacter sp. PT1]